MGAMRDSHGNVRRAPSQQDIVPDNKRFSDIPSAVEIVIGANGAEEAVEINLETIPDDSTELCTLLENEGAAKKYWMTIAQAYAKYHKIDQAIEVLTTVLTMIMPETSKERLPALSCLAWLYLWKSREAPRLSIEGKFGPEVKTKEYYLTAATTAINYAMHIDASFPPVAMARGVLNTLRASLHPPPQLRAPGSSAQSARAETTMQALKCFDECLRYSDGQNMWALLGKARLQYSLGKYADALDSYQEVLSKTPRLIDPDPRIGIGCCFWQLGYKEDAKGAWKRALELNPESPIANVLLGLYHLNSTAHLPLTDPAFVASYKTAMTEYTQRAFKLNKDLPLTCVTFGGYFYSRRSMPTVESLARKAVEYTDVHAVASDGWYLLARKEHHTQELSRACEYYKKADEARGGVDKGYLPAKLGVAQVLALLGDMDGAKLRLEKIVQQHKTPEAMLLLGTLYAEEVAANQAAGAKEDKTNERKRGISLLESVRLAWKDPTKRLSPDVSVLLSLAQLYEKEAPEKSRQCLLLVEQMELDRLIKERVPDALSREPDIRTQMREQLSPHLLNSLGCYEYQAENYAAARDTFQTALSTCSALARNDEAAEADALITTITYNLARSHEADGQLDKAKQTYEELLERHSDYTDASTRLAYIALRQSPNDEGPKAVAALMQKDPANLEARALYGWFLSRMKKRWTNIAEDPEQRHYKHTLQQFDKHDRYALTGMGNLYLTYAREMRRETEAEREKRRKMYEKAVELFDKALLLDPQNAYAAQGIAIALVEEKKDYNAAVQLYAKLRDSLRESNISVNMGHVYAELKQYSRAIEHYEAAVLKDKARDPQVLACLGRVWLLKGKQEKSIASMKRSLEYSQQALIITDRQVHYLFNVAFVQIQIAQLIYLLPEAKRTLDEVQQAARWLDEAIETLSEIAQAERPPYPKNDIEQRANMGRNTMRRQLERAVQAQREYEEKNAARLAEARRIRAAELQRLEEEKQRALEEEQERKRRIAEERQKIAEQDRAVAEQRARELGVNESEWETDSVGGRRRKKKRRGGAAGAAAAGGGKRRKRTQADSADSDSDEDASGEEQRRKKKRKAGAARKGKKRAAAATSDDGSDSDTAAAGGRSKRKAAAGTTDDGEDDGSGTPKKRRRVVRKGAGARSKTQYKSSELVVDSDSEADQVAVAPAAAAAAAAAADGTKRGEGDEDDDGEGVKRRRAQEADEHAADGGDEGDDDDEDDEDDEDAVRKPLRSSKRKSARAVDDDEEDDEDEDIGSGQGGGRRRGGGEGGGGGGHDGSGSGGERSNGSQEEEKEGEGDSAQANGAGSDDGGDTTRANGAPAPASERGDDEDE